MREPLDERLGQASFGLKIKERFKAQTDRDGTVYIGIGLLAREEGSSH